MNKQKLILPISILLGCIILGGFYYISQVKKQKYEIQQKIEEAKIEQVKREYVAKRKGECYEMYLKERELWNNVRDFRYSDIRDVCIIRMKSNEPAKSKEECDKFTENIELLPASWEDSKDRAYLAHDDCTDNFFSKEY